MNLLDKFSKIDVSDNLPITAEDKEEMERLQALFDAEYKKAESYLAELEAMAVKFPELYDEKKMYHSYYVEKGGHFSDRSYEMNHNCEIRTYDFSLVPVISSLRDQMATMVSNFTNKVCDVLRAKYAVSFELKHFDVFYSNDGEVRNNKPFTYQEIVKSVIALIGSDFANSGKEEIRKRLREYVVFRKRISRTKKSIRFEDFVRSYGYISPTINGEQTNLIAKAFSLFEFDACEVNEVFKPLTEFDGTVGVIEFESEHIQKVQMYANSSFKIFFKSEREANRFYDEFAFDTIKFSW